MKLMRFNKLMTHSCLHLPSLHLQDSVSLTYSDDAHVWDMVLTPANESTKGCLRVGYHVNTKVIKRFSLQTHLRMDTQEKVVSNASVKRNVTFLSIITFYDRLRARLVSIYSALTPIWRTISTDKLLAPLSTPVISVGSSSPLSDS